VREKGWVGLQGCEGVLRGNVASRGGWRRLVGGGPDAFGNAPDGFVSIKHGQNTYCKIASLLVPTRQPAWRRRFGSLCAP
jgi:hypothetical protein